jgi:hypothetical protein
MEGLGATDNDYLMPLPLQGTEKPHITKNNLTAFPIQCTIIYTLNV